MSEPDPPSEETERPEETALQRIALSPILRSQPRIEWTDGAGVHSVVLDGKTVAGSAASAGLVVHDPAVSRLHAELDPRADGLWVRDLGSRNGTFLEGLQVSGARVPEGGKLRLGSTDFTVDYQSGEKRPVQIWPEDAFGRLIGGSVPMRELFATLARVAPGDAPVLIQGETGTGKELVARAIHDASPRAHRPFIVVDCAALPDNLLDAELFGHTKGAFTGAVGARTGAFESADGGTVFLDEIGELPMAMQPKLLRVLESRTVRRVGETTHRNIDIRFLSATHRDLLTMVNTSEFREDLYFRIAVLPITVPPLRDRKDDIERLVHAFWAASGATDAVSPDLLRELAARQWRGNVRELRNFIERVRALGAAEALALTPQTGPVSSRMPVAAPQSASMPVASPPPTPSSYDPEMFERTYKDFRETWVDVGEREYIRRLLAKHSRNVASAAREAEVDRTYIYRLIRKHDL